MECPNKNGICQLHVTSLEVRVVIVDMTSSNCQVKKNWNLGPQYLFNFTMLLQPRL
jgi:hypothetical protein